MLSPIMREMTRCSAICLLVCSTCQLFNEICRQYDFCHNITDSESNNINKSDRIKEIRQSACFCLYLMWWCLRLSRLSIILSLLRLRLILSTGTIRL